MNTLIAYSFRIQNNGAFWGDKGCEKNNGIGGYICEKNTESEATSNNVIVYWGWHGDFCTNDDQYQPLEKDFWLFLMTDVLTDRDLLSCISFSDYSETKPKEWKNSHTL